MKTKTTLEVMSERAENKIRLPFEQVNQIEEFNQTRILDIFRQEGVSSFHFNPSTGYGYDDAGRETLERVYAQVFGTEAALVRPQFISGTHAITCALFGVLRPGDELLYITGNPYDTMRSVIGIEGDQQGTMKEYDISCRVIPLTSEGAIDHDTIKHVVSKNTKVMAIQRSRGYDDRPSLSIEDIRKTITWVKSLWPNMLVFVDNCYGEFVEKEEPGHAGADFLAGSLIKNPGGGVVKTGGYVCGTHACIEQTASRLAAPGIGMEGGATLYSLLEMFQGLFLAPHTVSQALKGAYFTSALFEEAGLNTTPSSNDQRTDLIQAVHFYNEKDMISFCQAIQSASPVDANVAPVPDDMPGYEEKVIMAAGTFIQGASIELSADGPVASPYTVYVQGGLTYAHVKTAVKSALGTVLDGKTKGNE